MQLFLPCTWCSVGACEITLKGGTNTDMAPPIDHLCFGKNYYLPKGFFVKYLLTGSPRAWGGSTRSGMML